MKPSFKICKRVIAIGMAAALLIPSYMTAYAASGETLYNKVTKNIAKTINTTDDIYYSEYLAKCDSKGAKNYTGKDITLKLAEGKYSPQSGFVKNAKSTDGTNKKAIIWKNDKLKSVEWNVNIPETGYYNIEVDYLSVTGSTTAPQRELYIDGRKKFNEMSVFYFQRNWEDDGEVVTNILGDEVRPKQKEVFSWDTTPLYDSQAKYSEPLKFYLTKGKHSLKFVYANEPLIISEIRVVAPYTYKTYAEVKQSYVDNGYSYYSGEDVRLEAEDVAYRSDPSLRIQSDSDPTTYPVSGVNTVYNTVGGGTWKTGGQSLTWNIEAPESGIYKLALRLNQNYTDGMPVYRRIEINGEVPFEDFLEYDFQYDKKGWTYNDIVDENGQPYELYLNKGTNTITMTAVLGDFAPIITTLEKDAYHLSELIQSIIKITTVNPDVNYDYKLDKKIDGLMDELQQISDSLTKQVADIRALSVKNPSSVNNLLMIQEQINTMIKDPFKIAKGLSELMESQSTMATWISEFQNSSLMLDYITLKPVQNETVNYRSNIFQKIGTSIQAFMISFVKDYDAIGNKAGTSGETEVIDVWISRAKEWAEVLQYMIDEEFTEKSNIAVKMNVVPSNQFSSSGIIMLAIAAGNAPDLALGVTASVPFEYGIRDAVYDLSKFDDYKNIESRFLSGMMIPFQNKGATYALPETMDFSVMFYRKDILDSLEIELPETWDELYSKVLPILKKNGMDFFYDGSVSTVSGAVSAAFHSLLNQHGGSYYTEDGKQSALDTPAAFTAFKQFTELYTIYDMPVSANVYTRFRAGTIPLAVGPFGTYIQLTAAAPEISGKWDVAPLPGVLQDDGKINRAYGGGTSAAMILEGSTKKQESWEFLKWYTDKETQIRYANDITSTVGAEARWCSANIEAFDNISWETNLKSAIAEQREWYIDMPNVIGGYITPRYIENARVRTVVQGKQYRDSLEKTVKDINLELTNKNGEFERRAAKEAAQNNEN